ncbi:MAG TPA: DUF2326 domain-containing protein [Methylotenera sp.]|nr:DUF2326 domain-containing protein [Methylotenera sp.]
MQLISLILSKAGTVIREIEFKDGLNLIIDSPIVSNTESGNNIGKTTVLRLIDYCFGSDGKDIWEDPEFKKVNQEVYDFLHGNTPVSVTLKLSIANGVSHELERRFVTSETKRTSNFFIDGKAIQSLKEYQEKVKVLLFSSNGPKPTLRQLMPKFVRSSPLKMSRTLKFSGDFSNEVTYETIHLFLFGFFNVDVLEERPRLDLKQKKQARDLEALTRDREEGEIEQLVFHLQREIADIEKSTALRGEVPEIAAQANAISNVRSEAATISGELSLVQGEIASLDLALDEFKRDFDGVDSKVIASVYKEAESFIPELHAKWEELSDFVINLRKRKERFISSQKEYLDAQRVQILSKLNQLEKIEAEQISQLSDSAEFQQAIAVRTDLLNKTKQLGSYEQVLQDIRNLKLSISKTADKIAESQKVIEEAKIALQDRLKVFNKHFSSYSKSLYGEQYLLHSEENSKNTLVFKLSAVGANVGTGKKASQTAAFDFAYCNFLQETGISFPKFICHDGLEAIHDNQLKALLVTADIFGGQLLVATLRDKLPDLPKEFVEACTVLELNQHDKLFKLS